MAKGTLRRIQGLSRGTFQPFHVYALGVAIIVYGFADLAKPLGVIMAKEEIKPSPKRKFEL